MSSRRFTRLTNAFSKKLENHAAAVSLYVAHYNMCRVHEALRTTQAVALGIADRGLVDRRFAGRRVGGCLG
jgi:2-methylaconitate cis-trans-isomerase PrpF